VAELPKRKARRRSPSDKERETRSIRASRRGCAPREKASRCDTKKKRMGRIIAKRKVDEEVVTEFWRRREGDDEIPERPGEQELSGS